MSLTSYHPTASPYVYQPLGKLQIRLLNLAPGEESDEIHIRLTHVDLGTDPHVDYEALSYAWGTSEPSQCVIVDRDDGSSQFLPVRDNLAHALRRIRDTTTTKILWADALCLNQEDKIEKSHQVPFMAEIYRRAARVIVWLGPERDDSASAMKLLRDLGETVSINWAAMQCKFSDSFPGVWKTLRNPALRTSVLRLLERDWFERLWVLQEVYLAQRSTVFCGPSEVEWTVFIRAGFCFTTIYARRQVELMAVHARSCPAAWIELRSVAGGQKCVDPRDKIYGMLAMLAYNDTHPLTVDYGLSVAEVYTTAMKHYVQTQNDLDLLDSCELTSNRMDSLPSWVPDWSSIPTSENLFAATAKATSRTRPFVHFPENQTMRLAGVMSSKVQFVEPLGRTVEEATAAILRFTQTIRAEENYVDGSQSLGNALFSTLIGGRYGRSGFPKSTTNPSKSEGRSAGRYIDSLVTGTQPDSEAEAVYLKHMNYQLAIWRGRALFLTEDGYIGLGFPAAMKGDDLFFPLGSSYPLLIRSSDESQRNGWLVVGACYVTGLMAGEILYGPLPSDCCLVSGVCANLGYIRLEFHRMDSNGELSSEPDLEFRKERPRKAFGVEDEELLTPELLRSKGVPVEWIDLV